MNYKELSRVISAKFDLSKTISEGILQTILQSIASELKSGRLVRLRNFGTFRARKSHGKLRAKFDDSKNFFKQ